MPEPFRRDLVPRPTDEQIGSWYPRLLRTALRMTGSLEESADLAQQAILQAMEGWQRFNGRASAATWVFRILVNCVQDRRRRQSRDPAPMGDEFDLADPSVPDAAGRASRQEDLRRLRQAMGELSADLRAAFVLTVLDGYTYQEAADLLSIPLGTVAFRVHEARKFLKATLRPPSET
jgi:RNA polymerase sigma-70 factor, ECF subfamily